MTVRRAGIAISVGCLAAALALSILTPSEELTQSPYIRTIPAENVAVDSREVTVTMTGARLADRVQTPDWTGVTDGVWLVVDLQFERRSDTGGIKGAFRIGDTDYALSQRADTASLDQAGFGAPGLPVAGSVLVELPAAALDDPAATHAVIQFSANSDPQLDGALEYTLDLTSLDHEHSFTLNDPQQVSP